MKIEAWSEVMRLGRPNLVIQWVMRTATHDSVVASVIGIASGQDVERSVAVKRFLNPTKGGRDSTMLTWMCTKQRLGFWEVLSPSRCDR